jgi:hypothetical protein
MVNTGPILAALARLRNRTDRGGDAGPDARGEQGTVRERARHSVAMCPMQVMSSGISSSGNAGSPAMTSTGQACGPGRSWPRSGRRACAPSWSWDAEPATTRPGWPTRATRSRRSTCRARPLLLRGLPARTPGRMAAGTAGPCPGPASQDGPAVQARLARHSPPLNQCGSDIGDRPGIRGVAHHPDDHGRRVCRAPASRRRRRKLTASGVEPDATQSRCPE